MKLLAESWVAESWGKPSADIRPAFQQVGGKTVAHGMRCHPLVQFAFARRWSHKMLESGIFCRYAPFAMKVLKRSNRFYDTERFGQPQIRLRHRQGKGVKSPSYVLRCGCCDEKVEIFYSDDGLELGGVNGALEDWREILLPLLLIERRGGRLVDFAPKPEKSANQPVQRTGATRFAQREIRTSAAAGSRH